jgi:hypothetical protein
MYYKSTFLGSDSFTVSGTIYDSKGDPKSGDKLIARIVGHEEEWSFETDLDDNQFSITINKTDDSGQSMPFNEDEHEYYAYDKADWIFSTYFFYGPVSEEIYYGNNPEGDKNMYSLDFYLNIFNDTNLNWLSEFTEVKPEQFSFDSIWYVYIPEPIYIEKGSYFLRDEFGTDHYYSYDCDFSKVGWYKIYHSYYPIGNNSLYTSSKNIKLYYED